MDDREDVVLEDRRVSPGRDVEPIDLDVLRGWEERRDPELRRSHRLPALGELVQLSEAGDPVARYPIRGPELLLGRYRARHGPVDLAFPYLKDHQAYRLAAPHARLQCNQDQWRLDVVSPRADTRVEGQAREHLHDPIELEDKTTITLGVTRFRFRTSDVSVAAWREIRDALLNQVGEPALFLKRRGGVCGPFRRLDEQRPMTIGRTHPEPGLLPDTDRWPAPDREGWDLSGLFDHERKYVGFRHLVVELDQGRWTVRGLSSRQRTFINRVAVSGPAVLKSGDEIGLGSVVLRFHHPHRSVESSRPRHVPSVVDWSGERPPGDLAERTESEEEE